MPIRAGHDVGVAVGKDDHIALLHPDRRFADHARPARASDQHVVFPEVLGVRHDRGRHRARLWRFGHPRLHAVNVEEQHSRR